MSHPARDTWTIRVEPLPSEVPAPNRIRSALKVLLRRFGLKCVAIPDGISLLARREIVSGLLINASNQTPAGAANAALVSASGNFQTAETTLRTSRATLFSTLGTGNMASGSVPIIQQLLQILAEQIALSVIKRGGF